MIALAATLVHRWPLAHHGMQVQQLRVDSAHALSSALVHIMSAAHRVAQLAHR